VLPRREAELPAKSVPKLRLGMEETRFDYSCSSDIRRSVSIECIFSGAAFASEGFNPQCKDPSTESQYRQTPELELAPDARHVC